MKKIFFRIIILGIVACSFFIMQNPTSPFTIHIKSFLNIPTEDISSGFLFSWYNDSGVAVSQDTMTDTSITGKIIHKPTTTSLTTWTKPTSEEPSICTLEYAPVCASVQVECIKAPCPPIPHTFGNACEMKANKLATFLYTGECKEDTSTNTNIANPASVNCEKVGGKLVIKDGTGGQYGECTLPSGKVCEERALYRGECGK